LAQIGEWAGLTPQAVCDIDKKRTRQPRANAAMAIDELFRMRVANNAGATRHDTDRLDSPAP
jgi:hypothetical protein